MIFKTYIPEVKAIDEAKRTIEHVISTGAVDRDGDIVSPEGWDLGEFLKNPVVLFGHRHDIPPIGRAESVEVKDGSLVSLTRFTPKGVSQFADEVFELNRLGFLRSWSVGFIGDEWQDLDKGGRRFTKQRLLEYSSVPIPANPEAVNLAVSKGVVTARTLDFLGWTKSTANHKRIFNFNISAAAIAERTRIDLALDTPSAQAPRREKK